MILNLAIGIASLIGVLCIGWWQLVNHRYREFQKYVKEGDPVIIFIGEERYNAQVLNIGQIFVDVISIEGKSKVERDEIYPVLGYNYKD